MDTTQKLTKRVPFDHTKLKREEWYKRKRMKHENCMKEKNDGRN